MRVGQSDGTTREEIFVMGSKYIDLGLIADLGVIAAGAAVFSSWTDNLNWVRNGIYLVSTDQSYDFLINKRDTSLQGDNNNTLISAAAALGSGLYRGHFAASTTAFGILGYSARFGIKNNGASPTTFAKIRAQLLGE